MGNDGFSFNYADLDKDNEKTFILGTYFSVYLHVQTKILHMDIFRKTLLAVAAAAFCVPAISQDLIRSNYKYNGYNHIRTERIKVDAGDKHPFMTSLEYIGFPDGSTAYMLELDYISNVSKNAPKGVPFSATATDGKIINAKQIYVETTDKRAFPGPDGKPIYWNKVQYLLEEGAVQKIASGVKNTDLAFSFEPDDYISTNYSNDEFGKAVKELYYAIKSEKPETEELGDWIGTYSNQKNSLTVITKNVNVKGDAVPFVMSMTYMYFKETHEEGYDLNLAIKSDKVGLIAIDTPVILTLEDGGTVELKQERDAEGILFLYPDIDQIKKIIRGNVTAIKVATPGKGFTDTFSNGVFSGTLFVLYNTLQTVSVL